MSELPPLPEPKAPPPGRKFPCRQCGAKLDFDPTVRGLKCPYCGFTEAIPEADDDKRAQVREHDLEEFLARQEERAGATLAGHRCQVTCTGCGAVVLLEDKVVTDKCPYCGTHLENQPETAKNLILPESLLPFIVSDRVARTKFRDWISGLWFAPTELRQLANLGQFGSVYAPHWTFDAMTYTDYTGERGDDYWDTESYTDSNGKRQTRSVRRTRWTSVSGDVQHFFDDVLIRASESLPGHLAAKIAPWELKELEPFRDAFLSGHLTERYSVSLKDGFGHAKEVMDDYITGLIGRDIGGDHQRIHSRRTSHVGVTFKHALLPIWVANYRYRERLFQVLVNGRSGTVAGDRPWSWWKIGRLIFLIVLAILLTVVLVGKVKGQIVTPPPGDGVGEAQTAGPDGRTGSAGRTASPGGPDSPPHTTGKGSSVCP